MMVISLVQNQLTVLIYLYRILFLGISDSSLEVLYSSVDVSGFQFGSDVVAAEEAGFTISTGGSVVLGYSLDSSMIPAGVGLLTNLDVSITDFTACISDVVVSDDNANQISFDDQGGCVSTPCADIDGDEVCDNVRSMCRFL